ncbi:hypothetical protein [Borrelia sp. P9F1]|uniref:hypothetical protein n=1 Tax=Borrelia sp. P9F1 TaxID=3058374 RepID=UPI0026476C88|nr:hypothetical protein [Borrelia sp. P9F1]WKC58593.1 hypothetical protein QYZ68_05180 [Borrelia sp. P9F1]
MRYSFLCFLCFLCCRTLDINEVFDKEFDRIERADYFLYSYPDSQIYIKKDKSSNDFSVFLNVVLDANTNPRSGHLKLIQDDIHIGDVRISKVVGIRNFKFLYINIDRNNVELILRALNPHKKLSFVLDSNSYQVWTRGTLEYDSRFIDVNFKSTRDTLLYALKSNLL